MDTSFDFRMEDETKWSRHSKHITIAGDQNDDGFNEVIVSAPGYPDYQNLLGKVYIYSYKVSNSIDDYGISNNPSGYYLSQNYPNPFNSTTVITYTINKPSHVSLKIYDIIGKEVTTLIDQPSTAGSHEIIWNGTDQYGKNVPSGLYYCQAVANGYIIGSRKIILLK